MNREEDIFEGMKESLLKGDKDEAIRLAKLSLDMGINPLDSIDRGLTPGIQQVGKLWEEGEYFLPQLVVAAECMKAALRVLEPALSEKGKKKQGIGRVVIGTAEGDIHDIGKTLVATMLSANGFEIIDLGADVPIIQMVNRAIEEKADLICISALLTTTMLGQKRLIELLREKGIRQKFKVMVGGAPVSLQWAKDIEADAYGENVIEAVSEAKRLVGA